MRKFIRHHSYQEYYEYHGNTVIERTRKQGSVTIRKDWILFDTVEEASEYFNNDCEL